MKEKIYTGNMFYDMMKNLPKFSKKSKSAEKKLLKIMKLSFYEELETPEKELYLELFCKEYPYFREKLAKDRDNALKEVIEISKKVRDNFINENTYLVIHIVKEYTTNIPIEDLIQEGIIGLMIAIKKFDVNKENKFITYAYYWIKRSLNYYIKNNNRIIRLPVWIWEIRHKVNNAENALYNTLYRKPTYEELASYLNISVKQVKQAKSIIADAKGFDDYFVQAETEDSEEFFDKYLSDKSDIAFDVIKKINLENFRQLLNNCNFDEATMYILKSYYELDDTEKETLEQMAKRLGISRNTVCLKKKEALKCLQKKLKANSVIWREGNND